MDEFLALGERERRNDTNSDRAIEFLFSAKPRRNLDIALVFAFASKFGSELVLKESNRDRISRTLAMEH